MDNKTQKELVIDQAKDIFAKIDALSLHPENKIMIYSRYLLLKVLWHVTVADLTKTWVEENVDSLYTYCLPLWLEIPPCGSLSNLCQNKSKFRLNVISFSTKYTQCQTVLRNCVSKSPNDDIKYIHMFYLFVFEYQIRSPSCCGFSEVKFNVPNQFGFFVL